MHVHTVLMLAATALVAVFVGIVVMVTTLQRRGRLGAAERQVEFATYGPVLAAACSGGAAAVHLAVVGEHASLSVASGTPDALALICSIGAGTTHFAESDAALLGFLPLGVLSLGAIAAQGALAIPRLWRSRRFVMIGLAVTIAALAVAVTARLLAPAPAAGMQQVAYSDWLAIVFDGALLIVVTLLISGRPRRLAEWLRVPVADAWIGTGLGVAAVGVFTIAGYLIAHAIH